jgi:hypothetical protein
VDRSEHRCHDCIVESRIGGGVLAMLAMAACDHPSPVPAPSPPPAPAPTPALALAPIENHVVPVAAAHCPPPPADQLEYDGAPPWERDPLGRWPTSCIESSDGSLITIESDPSDVQGWHQVLIVLDGARARFKRDIRAISAMAVAPDGGAVLAHTEDAVSRYSPSGALLWKTAHPYCGSPEVAVGYDGRVVLGCGYSLVAYSADGKFEWQKWPLGNTRIRKPLIASDGTMIVSGDGVVLGLGADGSERWRVDTGANRYVHPIGVRPDGTLVFITSMAALHTRGDMRMYYPSEPDELFMISRAGKILSREKLGTAPKWPESQSWTPALRSGRLP